MEIKNSNHTDKFYDVVVVGGGMVGAAMAVALCRQNKRVLLVEKHQPSSDWLTECPLRVSAINLFSQQYLTELDIWRHIVDKDKCVFKQLATWEQRNQPLVFTADDIQKSHLGHIVRNEALQLACYQAIGSESNRPDLIFNSAITSIEHDEQRVEIQLVNQEQTLTIQSHLLIGADGALSKVRSLVGIGISGWDYQQHCLSMTVKTEFATQDITWQEFQASGPKAFLPLNDGFACLIWYDAPEKIKQLQSLDVQQLKKEILVTFPPLAGEFEITKLASFPLARRQANQYYSGRIVLVGDAAHTINPLAGQGVNLGYKDVSTLAKLLESVDLTDSMAVSDVLTRYQVKGKINSNLMSSTMDVFYKLFSNECRPLKKVRSALLVFANKATLAKKQLLKKAVGL